MGVNLLGLQKFSALSIFLLAFSVAAMAVAGPVITSPTDDSWQRQPYLPTQWGAVEGANGYSYIIDSNPDTIPDNEIETTSTQDSIPSKISGKYYLHIKAVLTLNSSDTTHLKINFDKETPEPPVNVVATIEGKNVKITWDAATDEGGSGIDHYILYRGPIKNFSIADISTRVLSNTLKETNYTDANIPNGAFFNYKVQAADGAGNLSRPSFEASVTAPKVCQIQISINFEKTGKNLKILVSSEGGPMFYAGLTATIPGKAKEQLIEGYTGLTTFDETISIEGIPDGTIKAEVLAKDKSINDCNATAEYIIDNNKPEVSWLSPVENQAITGAAELKVNAKDIGTGGSGIDSVEIFSGFDTFAKLGNAESIGNNQYTFDWNTFNEDNGRIKLKAIAKDKGGNASESVIIVSVTNTLLQKGTASASIKNAESKRLELLQASDIFPQDSPVFTEKFNELVNGADQNLERARGFLEKGTNLDRAKDLANGAAASYAKAVSMLGAEKYNSLQSAYTEQQAEEMYRKAGLKSSLIAEAKTAFTDMLVTRKIDFYKVSSDNNQFYLATVSITFSSLGSAEKVNVIEIVPKEFAGSGNELSSPQEMRILKKDPIIAFGPVEGPKVSYSLNRPLTKDEADELIAGNVQDLFSAPPIVLSGETAVDSSTVVEPFDASKAIKSITNIFSGIDSTMFLIIVAVIVILVVGFIFVAMAGIIIFLLLKRRR